MQFLREKPAETGCCCLRYQQTCNSRGDPAPEAYALGYLLSFSHLEQWAERHPSHHAIFSGALAQHRKYCPSNQLGIWHEVYVLPERRQPFEYLNCHPGTSLLSYLEAEQVAGAHPHP